MSSFVRSDNFSELRTYRTIVADPPWPYDGAGTPGTGGRGATGIRDLPTASAADRYGLMTMEELKGLPVSEHCKDNAHLYLWTTNAFMVEAHDLARAWGFKPKTIITWVKMKLDGSGPSCKTGYYFRGATEHVLFAVRGSLRLSTRRAVPTAFLAPRLPHSVKPKEFFDLVEECSPERRLEMFARVKRKRWDSFGNQIEGWA